jgi:hypothetical protein
MNLLCPFYQFKTLSFSINQFTETVVCQNWCCYSDNAELFQFGVQFNLCYLSIVAAAWIYLPYWYWSSCSFSPFSVISCSEMSHDLLVKQCIAHQIWQGMSYLSSFSLCVVLHWLIPVAMVTSPPFLCSFILPSVFYVLFPLCFYLSVLPSTSLFILVIM